MSEQVVVSLANYPLDDPAKRRELLNLIEHLQAQGATKLSAVLEKPSVKNDSVELDELEQLLTSCELSKEPEIIRSWVKNLSPEPAMQPVDGNGNPRRRYVGEVEKERNKIQEWVTRLNDLFKPLENTRVNVGKIERDYNVSSAALTRWKQKGYLEELGRDKNKILLDEKAVMVAITINKRFAYPGSTAVTYAMEFYKSLKS